MTFRDIIKNALVRSVPLRPPVNHPPRPDPVVSPVVRRTSCIMLSILHFPRPVLGGPGIPESAYPPRESTTHQHIFLLVQSKCIFSTWSSRSPSRDYPVVTSAPLPPVGSACTLSIQYESVDYRSGVVVV